jgi:four helix bundle protein
LGVQNYRDLIAWQKGMEEAIYRVTATWPQSEMYGLTSQTRRAAVSFPANIAEGQGRTGAREFLHHLSIANGSLRELETLLLIARRLQYLSEADCTTLTEQANEVGRIILGLIRSLR